MFVLKMLLTCLLITLCRSSIKRILPLAMYHGGDEDYLYIKEFMSQTIKDIEEWAANFPTTCPRGWTVKWLLGGDTHWLWTIMGLAKKGTCFCTFCTCNTNERGQTHNANTISFPCREYKKHLENYTEFTSNNSDLKRFTGHSIQICFCAELYSRTFNGSTVVRKSHSTTCTHR